MHAEIKRNYERYRPFCDREIAVRRAGKAKEAAELILKPQLSEARTVLIKSVNEFEDYCGKLRDEALKRKACGRADVRARRSVMHGCTGCRERARRWGFCGR